MNISLINYKNPNEIYLYLYLALAHLTIATFPQFHFFPLAF